MVGEITKVKRNDGTEHLLCAYLNSSDFPDYNIIVMGASNKFPAERVPINEDIWREIGKSFGYRFVIRKKLKTMGVSDTQAKS